LYVSGPLLRALFIDGQREHRGLAKRGKVIRVVNYRTGEADVQNPAGWSTGKGEVQDRSMEKS